LALAAITGASGLLGSNLAVELLKQGHQVRATRRAGSKVAQLEGHAVEWVSADLGDAAALAAAFAGADVVFHCAAKVTVVKKPPPDIYESNVAGTARVIEAVRKTGVRRMVHCSTTGAVGLSEDGRPCTEDAAWNFAKYGLDDAYFTTKHEAELLVLAAAKEGLDAVVVNPGFMFGPMDVRPSSGKLILEVARRKAPGKSPGMNSFVDVRDVARGMVLAWEKGRSGERYILAGENLSYGQVMDRVAKVAGVKPPRFYVPQVFSYPVGWWGDLQVALGRPALINSMALRHAYGTRFTFSSAKAERELGWTRGPLDVAIADALAWFRQAGML
jgi:dihydroflavonol-4-reductase